MDFQFIFLCLFLLGILNFFKKVFHLYLCGWNSFSKASIMCLDWYHFDCTILSQKVRSVDIQISLFPNSAHEPQFWLILFFHLHRSYTYPPCWFYSDGVFSTVNFTPIEQIQQHHFTPLEHFVHFILLHELSRRKTGDYFGVTY